MFQLRWANLDVGVKVLQYRTRYPREVWGGPDSLGTPRLEGYTWTDWQDVPTEIVSRTERIEGIGLGEP